MDTVATILKTITEWADEIGAYALALAAVGTLSMALLEAVKGMFKLKPWFQEYQLKGWLTDSLRQYLDAEMLASNRFKKYITTSLDELPNEAVKQVVSLATVVPTSKIEPKVNHCLFRRISPEKSLYTLQLEKMMGQIQESVEIILNNPHLYSSAFFLLSSTADPKDVNTWLSCRDPEQSGNIAKADAQEIARAGNRIQQSVQRQLDTFQLRVGYFWTRLNQSTSFILGAGILYFAICNSSPDLSNTGRTMGLFEIFILSLLGGFMAPVAKDLVTNLRKVKDT